MPEHESEDFLAKIGTWEQDEHGNVTFRFHQSREISGHMLNCITFSQGTFDDLPPGVRREDLIWAFLNPDAKFGKVAEEKDLGYVDFTIPARE